MRFSTLSALVGLSVAMLTETARSDWLQTNGPYGAYVLSIVRLPNGKLLAGTNGGVFRSTNNGSSWSNVFPTPINAVGAKGTILLVGVGADADHGGGIFRSADDGDHWTMIDTGLGINQQTQCFAAGDTTIYTGGFDAGVYRSNDTGGHWTQVINNLYPKVNGLWIRGSTLLAAAWDGVYRSTDKGDNWTIVLTGDRYSRTFAQIGTVLFAGTRNGGGPYRSTDDGQTWASIYNGVGNNDVYSMVTIGTHLFIGTGEIGSANTMGVYVTVDSGQTWTSAGTGLPPNTPITSLATMPDGSGGTDLLAGTGGSGIYLSADSGVTWTPINTGLSAASILGLVATITPNGGGSDTNLFAGVSYGGLFRSTDKGTNWTPISSSFVNTMIQALGVGPNGTDIFAATNNNRLGGGGTYARMYRSTTNGSTWTAVNSGLPSTEDYGAFSVIAETLFVGSPGAGIYRTTDNGGSWTLLPSQPGNIHIKALAARGDTLYAATIGGGVYRSTDDGRDWTVDTAGLGTNLNSLAIGLNGTNIYLSALGCCGPRMFVSTNAGINWTEVAQFEAHALAFFQKDAFAGLLGGGIQISADTGNTWTDVNAGLNAPSNTIQALAVSGSSLYMGTSGGFSSYEVPGALPRASARMPSHPPAVFSPQTKWVLGVPNSGIWARPFSEMVFYTIATSSGPHGFIAAPDPVGYSLSRTVTISPNAGYHVDSLFADGLRVDSTTSYTFRNVMDAHTIRAVFAINHYSLNPSAGPHGSISPPSNVDITYGSNQTFTMTPAVGYHVDTVLVDGIRVDSTLTYTFRNISSSHTIRAVFAINHYTISVIAGAHGSISPSSSVTVSYGSNQSFTVTQNQGYFIDTVLVDGIRVDSTLGYTFYNISASHSIRAVFGLIVVTVRSAVSGHWNMISVPVVPLNDSVKSLFSGATSHAFAYSGGSYTIRATMNHGSGYWLKFAAPESVTITGPPLPADTVAIGQGWNMIGSISHPIAVAAISSIPGGIVTSNFFRYAGNYVRTDSIHPGEACWVKSSMGGQLILSSPSSAATAAERIRIISINELPPSPPGAAKPEIPALFDIAQNFPNPFNPSTTIRYQLPVPSRVTVKVYDVVGREIATLVEEVQDPGYRSVQWDASAVASGLYFYRIDAAAPGGGRLFSQVRKMALVR